MEDTKTKVDVVEQVTPTETQPQKKSTNKTLLIFLLVIIILLLAGIIILVIQYIKISNSLPVGVTGTGNDVTITATQNPDDMQKGTLEPTSDVTNSPILTPTVEIIQDELMTGKINKISSSEVEFAEWVYSYPDSELYLVYCSSHNCGDGQPGADIPLNTNYTLKISPNVSVSILRNVNKDCNFDDQLTPHEISITDFLKDQCKLINASYTPFFKFHVVDNKVVSIAEEYRP